MLEHRAQVLGVEQQQAVGIGDAEHKVQHALLGVVEFEHPRQQQRPHVRDRRAHRMPFFAEDIPERGRAGAPGRFGQPVFRQAGLELVRGLADLRYA
ncbi:hypothetical protein D3C87_1161280 [compost metagenome]